MAKMVATLYIDDTSLRLMVTDGKQIKEWAELPLEPGLIQNAAVIKEAEVVAKIKELLKDRKAKDKKIMVGVSGLRCLTRPMTLPQLPEAMLDEAVRREAERVLPVPLEQLYISWQTIPAPEGKTQVFLVAIPRKTADDLLKALQQAGLKPSFMNLKPLLLARVVKEATAVLVDVQTTDFDVVIMTDGVPQPVRTIPFAEEALPWQEKLVIIRNELNRTVTFYNSNNPEKPLASSVPIFVSGGLANELELCQSLSAELGHPVLPLPSPLECPEGFDLSRYSVNIGLALQSEKETGASAVSLNALPVPYQPKPISLVNILALPGAVVAAGLLVFLVILIQGASADIASTSVQLTATDQLFQQKLSQRKELTGSAAELQKKINELETSNSSFTAALGSLEKQNTGTSGDLEVTLKSLPYSISPSSISYTNSILTISGWAPSEREVLLWLKKLDASGRFGGVTITNMTRLEDGRMEFTLLGSLTVQSNETSNIEAAVSSLPATISLLNLSSNSGILTINGQSPDEDKVLSYLQSLEASGKFRQITITSLTRNEDGGMNFSLILKGEEILEGAK